MFFDFFPIHSPVSVLSLWLSCFHFGHSVPSVLTLCLSSVSVCMSWSVSQWVNSCFIVIASCTVCAVLSLIPLVPAVFSSVLYILTTRCVCFLAVCFLFAPLSLSKYVVFASLR